MLDYDNLSRILVCAGAEPDAAEFHGFLCGQACVSDLVDEDLWKDFADVRTPDNLLAESCYAQLRVLAADIQMQLQAPGFEFQLMLPDDECPMARRVAALGAWCQGFLSGVGSGDNLDESAFSEDCREVLKDISMICRVDVDQADAEDDAALEEVVEYVRVGAMTLFEDMRVSSRHPAPGVYH